MTIIQVCYCYFHKLEIKCERSVVKWLPYFPFNTAFKLNKKQKTKNKKQNKTKQNKTKQNKFGTILLLKV